MKTSEIAHNIVVGSIEAWPTKRITQDFENAFRVDIGSKSSLYSSYHQSDSQGPEKHDSEYVLSFTSSEQCLIARGSYSSMLIALGLILQMHSHSWVPSFYLNSTIGPKVRIL